MKKFLLLFSFLGGIVLSARAQQLPNYGFNNWKSACASTESLGDYNEMRQRPGVEPTDWNGSSVNQAVKFVFKVEKEQELIYNDNSAVKMVNTFVGAMGVGSVAPGFINFGTPWVYATKTVKECDGGVYGGINFTNKPDAITGRYKRTDATGEKSHIIVYLWNGTFTSKVGKKGSPSTNRDNVDKAIMGMTDASAKGTLVASCDYEFTATTNQDWQTITVPLTYSSETSPTMMNTIISSGDYWYRENMKENTTLIADDIRFVYYSTLKSLSYNGTALSIPASNGTLDMSSVTYDASKLAYTLNGQTATATTSYNEESGLLTIVVSNVDTDIDGQSSHTYYIQFAKPVHEHTFKYEAAGASLKVLCSDCGEALGTITMVLPSDLTYSGKAKAVTLEGAVEGVQNPTVVYSSGNAPIKVGTYTASITLGGATATIEYIIKAKDIAAAVVGNFEAMTYTGKAQTPAAKVTLEGYGLVTGTWSEVINVTDKTTFTANGNYTGSISNVACNMQAKDIAAAVVGNFAAMTYTGKAQTPAAEVTLEGYGAVTGTWSQVTNVTDETTFTANGNYTGAISNVACNMQAKDIAGATVGTFATMTYTGKAQTPTAEVTLEGYGVVTGTWSQVTNVIDKATFTANGNYTGTISNVACNMQAKDIAGATVGSFATMTYTGKAQTPAAEVTLEGYGVVTGTWSQVTNVADKATFTANGNYTGTLRASTGMVPMTITVLSASIADVAFDAEGNYTFVVTNVAFDTELAATDYTTTTQLVGENVEGTTSEVLITFDMLNTNYAFAANTLTATVNLLKHEHEWTYTADGATIYATCSDTNANCPTPTATITLQAPLDATYSGAPKRVTLAGNYPGLTNLEEFITYEGDCTSVGTHTASINYEGVVATLEFTILPKDMTDEVVVKGIADSYEFTGELIEPSITVMYGDTALVEGQDYVVTISDNLEAGTGTVLITFMGNYSGSTTITFAIIDTTIEAIMQSEHIVCYDLYGRRVLEPLKGEIYIINGKKVRW